MDEIPRRRVYVEVKVDLKFGLRVILRCRFGQRGRTINEEKKKKKTSQLGKRHPREFGVKKNKKCFKTFQLSDETKRWSKMKTDMTIKVGDVNITGDSSRKYGWSTGQGRLGT